MYETPRIEKFGSFRELTLQTWGKTTPGMDIIPGTGNMCNPQPDVPGGITSCIRS